MYINIFVLQAIYDDGYIYCVVCKLWIDTIIESTTYDVCTYMYR